MEQGNRVMTQIALDKKRQITDVMLHAISCKDYNPKMSGMGNCNRKGYAPFDCYTCTSYINKDDII